jgi:alpha-tubulin suppressor-like RCC1 family protein
MSRVAWFLTVMLGALAACDYPANLLQTCTRTSDCPERELCGAASHVCEPGCLARECGTGPRGESCGDCPGGAYCDDGGYCRVAGCGNDACEVGESPVSCPEDCAVAEVALTGSSACFRFRSGVIRCAGEGSWGELGDGELRDRTGLTRPVRLDRLALQVAAGWGSFCALVVGGEVWCWGAPYATVVDGFTAVASGLHQIPLRLPATSLAMGIEHACAVLGDGTVSCWGENGSGQLGVGQLGHTDWYHPVEVAGLSGIAWLALGWRTSCAVTASGLPWCWGDSGSHQILGAGFNVAQLPPLAQPLADVTSLSTGFTGCAALGDGTLWCWGDNQSGQLGNGTTQIGAQPVQVPLDDVVQVSGSSHTCAVDWLGQLWCWGSNAYGQLGDGSTDGRFSPPTTPAALEDVIRVTAGGEETCAVTADGGAWCWGLNGKGQLSLNGNPEQVLFPQPVRVAW